MEEREEFYVDCCVCKRRREGDEWINSSDPNYETRGKLNISHTYCPPCYDEALKELRG
tara:strand:- start:692 stop:865 length:174 start_codon:yes stop_codon:yes gene_type:complete